MEFITGALLMICLFEGYLLYERRKPKKVSEIDKREKEAQEHRDQHLNALLNYDAETAYRGRK